LRRRSFSSDRAFGSRDHSEEYGHPRSPLQRDAKGEDSEARTRRLESEDTRYQSERGMEELDPAERWRNRVGADPVVQVAVEEPDVGDELDPSREPALDGVDTDQQELGRSLLARGSWRQGM
jgi:hypothetical protein